VLRVLVRVVLGVLAVLVLAVVLIAGYVAEGWLAEAHLDGTLSGLPVHERVVVLRDGRGIPHVRARSYHDLMIAQGYLEGADRLFQIDLYRHLVYGRLAEWFGTKLLSLDEHSREFDVAGVIATQYAKLSMAQRDELQAFADGVNAAIAREPLPVEYRILWMRPEPWKPQDTLAVGFATVLSLTDPWDDVIEREGVYERFGRGGSQGLYSITDPRYDVPLTGSPAPVASLPPLPVFPARSSSRGSNEWAVGANRTREGRALLANDPHLDITMPGIWYLIDLQAPGFHVAGATLAGTPGVILGHNERVAWGATNGNVIAESIYAPAPLEKQRRRTETFHARFDKTVMVVPFKSDNHGFYPLGGPFSVDWPAAADPISPETTFEELDRANSLESALAALAKYPGPTQNFVLADTSGRATYHMAGAIPNDPLWGLRAHKASDPHYPPVAFTKLPQVAPSRDAVVFTANNRVYGRGYPLRLTAWFAPPYRAARVKQLLDDRMQYDVAHFAQMQKDTLSLVERELAKEVVVAARRHNLDRDAKLGPLISELAHWDGRFDPHSKAASLMYRLRTAAMQRFIDAHFSGSDGDRYRSSSDVVVVMMRALRENPKGYFPKDDRDGFLLDALSDAARTPPSPWGEAGALPVRHVFSAFGLSWFNGASLPGDGDAYTVHAQLPYAGQSFRAVWDVGNWDAGGIVIPSGESGRPGSAHHDDAHATWVDQTLVPLPFSDAAVDAAARHRLVLSP